MRLSRYIADKFDAYGIVSVEMRAKQKFGILLLGLCLIIGQPVTAQYSSSNYKIEESFFGTGGEVDASSSNYRANQSAGSLGVGNVSSSNYDAVAGYVTPNEPFLEMYVTGASVDFGTLSDATTSSGAARAGDCNCSFFIRTYLSSEYSVVTLSQPPTNESGDILTAKSTLAAPSTDQSVEEFGINLVDNSSPDIGANAINQPDGTFADGTVAAGYNTVNQFKYGVGDTIARSPATVGNQAVGKTEYTISYIAKRNAMTAAGLYVMRHELAAVPTY